jgi:hypothetical protein
MNSKITRIAKVFKKVPIVVFIAQDILRLSTQVNNILSEE